MSRFYQRLLALMFFLFFVTFAFASRWQGLDEGFSVEISNTDSIRLSWNAANVNPEYLRYLQRENPATDELCAACWVAVPRGKLPSLTRVTGFPENGTVYLGDPHCMRDLWMVPVNVQMLTPALAEGNVTAGTLTITFTNNVNTPSPLTRGISTVFYPLYHTMVPNFNEVTPNYDVLLPPQLLVIAPSTLIPAQPNPLNGWITWRKSLGWQVRVATLTEVGGNNATTIKNWIQNAYNTWTNPPDAVYIIGDETMVVSPFTFTSDPSTIFSGGSGGQPYPGDYSDEHTYVRLDGPTWRTTMPDPLPDALFGRMLATNIAEVSTQATKTVFYEQLSDTCNWLNRAIVGADQQTETQRATKRWTANRMLENGTTGIDSLYSSSSGNSINELVRTGRSVINYRGSGWTYGWAGIGYLNPYITSCQNSLRPFVITGIGCGVALFTQQQCFGEMWMKLGTTSDVRGTVGFIGPTWNTHTQFNNQLDIGLYRFWHRDKVSSISLGLLAGKAQMIASFAGYYPTDSNIREILRAACGQYLCLNDPALNVQVSRPHRVQVTGPIAANLGQSTLSFTVTDQNSGLSKENLLVSVFDASGVKGSGWTNSQGNVSIPIMLSVNPGFLKYSVSGIQTVPFRDSMTVSSSDVSVFVNGFEQVDTSGIHDGLFSPGEAGRFSFDVRNQGIAISNLQIHAVSLTPSLQILTTGMTIDSLRVEETIRIDGMRVSLSPEYRGGTLPIQIYVLHNADTVGGTQYLLQTSLPQIGLISAIADPTGNSRLDRNETTTLQLEFHNNGSLFLRNATVTVETNNDTFVSFDPQSIVIDSLASNAFWSSGMRLQATASRYLPAYHPLRIRALVSAQYPTWTYRDTVEIEIITGTIDSTAPSRMIGQRYYAYESSDSLYTEAPEFEWHDIAPRNGGSGDSIAVLNRDAVNPMDVPINFVYFGTPVSRISISVDGWISAVPTDSMSRLNSELPNEDRVHGMIAPWWEDLWLTGVSGEGLLKWHDVQNHRFIIQWDSIACRAGLPRLSFQIILYDATIYPTLSGDSRIEFVYNSLEPSIVALVGSTVGIESIDEQTALQLCYDATLDSTASTFRSQRSIRFTSNLPRIKNSDAVNPRHTERAIPTTFRVDNPYPNPFNPETQVMVSLPVRGKLTVALFDALGRQAEILYSGTLNAGEYPIAIRGNSLSAGVYFVSVRFGNTQAVRKIVLLK